MSRGTPIGNMVVRVDLDKTGFEKSMTGLNRQLKSVNQEMKTNLSQFSRTDRSIAKFETKISGLTKRYSIQEKAVESARIEHEKMIKTYGEGSIQADRSAQKLNESIAKYNQTGRALTDLKADFSAFQKEQKIMDSGWTKTGHTLQGFGGKLQDISSQARDVGSKLTKGITLPVLAVGGAMAGVVANLGWGRLVALDGAKAKLEGLGYSVKDVGRITEQVTRAVEGGMTTMAEGTDIAAGGLAAGVKEGKELEKYIKLVGDAAVGSGRPVSDMAQIFNKIQGGGKLMTQELNQVELAMPGFAGSMAKSLNVSQDTFREMVTDGKISSDMFLDNMDSFAGGMAEAYSKSWSGMVKNTFAYVGMIGQVLLDGVFHKSKDSIAEFIELLSSETVHKKAEELGKKISKAFTGVVDALKGAIKWYRDLSSGQKDIINGLAILLVSIGPIIGALGIFGGIIGRVISGLGGFSLLIGKLGGLLRVLGMGFTFLVSPVGLVIAGIALLVAGFVTAYKKSEPFRRLIDNLVEKFKDFGTKIPGYIDLVITKIKEFGQKVLEFIQPAIDSVVDLFNAIKDKIQGFVKSDGEQLISAFGNIGKFIGVVAGGIGKAVEVAFGLIQKTIEFVMPAVMFVIDMVWGNIKGLITGALDVIMGAVKVFSGLFTGDFGKMWEGIKQMFFGAIAVVWNYINLLFVGRILKVAGSLVKMFGSLMSGMWTKITGIFSKAISGVYNFVSNGFTKMLNTIKNISTSIRTTVTNIWNTILNKIKNIITSLLNVAKSIFTSIFNTIKNITTKIRTTITSIWNAILSRVKSIISNLWNSIKSVFSKIFNTISSITTKIRTTITNIWNAILSRIKNIVSALWNSIRSTFNSMFSGIRSISSRIKGSIVNSWKSVKSTVTGLVKGLWTSVKLWFGKIVDQAKALPGKIGSGIRSSKGKAVSGMKSVGNSLIRWAGKPFNKVVDGVNWVTSKLGIKKNIGKWNYPQYAKGTGQGGHPGGMAMIGEEGRELVQLPNGKSFISPGSHTMLNLPKGTHVTPNKMTEKLLKADLPHYAKGTKGWFGNMKSSIGDVWDYIKNPRKIVTKLMDKISLQSKMAQIPKAAVSAGFGYIKNKPIQFIKDMFNKQKDTEHNPNAGGGKPAFSWPITSHYGYRTHPITGGRRLHGGTDFGAPSGAPIPSTTGGKVSSVVRGYGGGFGNHVKVKSGIMEMLYAHMSSIAVRQGQKVKKGQLLGRIGSTGASTGPHLHYETRKNGARINPMSIKGHKTGGLIQSQMMSMLGEDGQEMVIPLNKNRRSDAMKLLALTGKMLGVDKGKSKLPHQLPSMRDNKSSHTQQDNQQLKDLLSATLEQNNILMQLLHKDTTIVMDGKEVGKGVAETVTKRQSAKTDYNLAKRGLKGVTI